MNMGDETNHDENANENRQGDGESEMINKKPRTTDKREEENIVAIAKNQIDGILLFVRCWENQHPRPEESNTYVENQDNQQQMSQPLGDEDAQITRAKKAPRNFKRDIVQYLRTRGFIPGKGKGEGEWGRSARM